MLQVRRRAEDAVKKKIEPALKSVTPEDAINLHKTNDIRHILELLMGDSVSKTLISDIFNMLFLPVPVLRDDYPEKDNDHYQAMQNLLAELSKMQLREQTVSNIDNSTVATVNIITNLINSMKQMQGNGDSNQQQAAAGASLLDKWLDGKNGKADQLQQMLFQSQGNKSDDTGKISPGLQQQINDKARRAAHDAEQSEEGLDELMERAENRDQAQGTLKFDIPDPRAKKLADNTAIERLLSIISGSRGMSSSSSEKTKYGRGEYSGYGLGGDLMSIAPPAYIYPREFLIALYAQNKMPQYRHQIKQRIKDKYVLFDKSASMIGNKLTFAKSLTLALYNDSLSKSSDFTITYFDENPYGAVEVLHNAKRDRKEAMSDLIDMVRSDGCTDINSAIYAACADISDKNKSRRSKDPTQIILISDGESCINESHIRERLDDANAELIVVYVNSSGKSSYVESLLRVSSHFFAVNTDSSDVTLSEFKSN
ncbi:MAG: VWA domain-containing protein [Candidatus Marsarchaeota archaeon]|nr:VWA domain-containing protein [Candidatus Marsarchaeota archaeon]MCL5413444.1 VWA domain-containing protein [Candidatus Marsarchaeota archaeon]